MKKYKSEISGHLDITIINNEGEFGGNIQKWQDVLIHGEPEGLRSFAQLLIKIADLNQDTIKDLPIGARTHIHLQPGADISKSSAQVIIGRLDAKGTGAFYDSYLQKNDK